MNLVGPLLSVLLSMAPPTQDRPRAPQVFGVEIENVYIDAFVSRHGGPLLGLAAADFELRDNGVVQRLELVASDAQPLRVVLAFDASGSLDEAKLAALRAAGKALLDTLRPEDEATLFAFSDDIQWLAPPTTDKTAVRRSLERVTVGGGTAIMNALYASVLLPGFRGRTLVVLFTDGFDNLSWLDWRQVKRVAERSNAVIHVVGLRRGARGSSEPRAPNNPGSSTSSDRMRSPESHNTWALRQITDATGGAYWEAESLDRLTTAFAAIADAMGKRYVLRYAPENVERPGWHKIELRLRGKKGDVRTRSGYWVRDR